MISRKTVTKLLIRTGVRETLAEHCAEVLLLMIEADEDQLILTDADPHTSAHRVLRIEPVGGATADFVSRESDAEIHIARRFKGRP